MRNSTLALIAAALASATSSLPSNAQSQSSVGTVPVTVDNFIRAESDRYFSAVALNEDDISARFHRSTIRTLSGRTATRSIRRVFSTSTPDP